MNYVNKTDIKIVFLKKLITGYNRRKYGDRKD